jgi:hypothetical protein
LDDDPLSRPLVENQVVGGRSNDKNLADVGLGAFEVGYCAQPPDTAVAFYFKDIKGIKHFGHSPIRAMQAEVLVAHLQINFSPRSSAAVATVSYAVRVISFVRWLAVLAGVFLGLLMHAHDVIQSEQIMFNPAQDRLLKIFATSSLLTVLRGESAP